MPGTLMPEPGPIEKKIIQHFKTGLAGQTEEQLIETYFKHQKIGFTGYSRDTDISFSF